MHLTFDHTQQPFVIIHPLFCFLNSSLFILLRSCRVMSGKGADETQAAPIGFPPSHLLVTSQPAVKVGWGDRSLLATERQTLTTPF